MKRLPFSPSCWPRRCGAAPAQAALNVVTTTQDMASIAQEVGGDKIKVTPLAKGYQDPHFVEAKPSFVLILNKANLLIVVGRDLELGWLPPLITQSRNAKIQPGAQGYLDPSTSAKILEMPTGAITRAEGDVHPLGNPHYWLDPENGRRIAKAIQGKLAADGRGQRGLLRAARGGLRNAPDRGAAALEGADGPVQGAEGRHLSPLVGEFRRRVRPERRRLRRAEAGHSADAAAHARRDQRDEGAEHQDHHGRACTSTCKTPNSIASNIGAKVVMMPPSVGGVPQAGDYFKLFDYDLNLLVDAIKATGAK